MRTVCFTGHRIIRITDKVRENLRKKIVELIEKGVTDFYAGGAVGFDMLCEQTVLRLRCDFPNIRLHIVMPCPAEEQTYNWSEENRFEYSEILVEADSREIVSKSYTYDCMKKRNQRLVDLADCCICYHN